MDGQRAARALLEAHSYTPAPEVQSDIMVRPTLEDLPHAPLAAGPELRPAGAGDRRAAWELL